MGVVGMVFIILKVRFPTLFGLVAAGVVTASQVTQRDQRLHQASTSGEKTAAVNVKTRN
tara:strand:- start:89 stop:265 length:177 start_codon:yes stop_codon:yes gene_type:complete